MYLHKSTPALTRFLFLIALLACASLQAGERRFTYVYETTTAAKGEVEIENWATWKTGKNEEGNRGNEFNFRHEIEYGVTDHFQLSLYVVDWTVVDNIAGGEKGAQAIYDDTALEAIYSFTNPVTDIIGSALYGEIQVGDLKFAMESKLLLQKNFGPIVIAYNASFEAEWEGERFGSFEERHAEFQQTLGASYQFTPNFLLGGEFLHEITFPEWAEAEDSVVYVGPNASFRYDRYYLTATAMIQATAITEEPDFQLRAIFGFHF